MQQAQKIAKLNCLLENFSIDDPNFLIRLGSNFSIIHDLFEQLYFNHPEKDNVFTSLIQLLIESFSDRNQSLKKIDAQKSKTPSWYSSEKIVGMMLYTDRFNKNMKGVTEKISYFEELGVNLLHLMPFLAVPQPENDGGYAVEDYRKINPLVGNMDDFITLTTTLHDKGMMVMMDFVLNHCANTHEWASKAQAGDSFYQDYFYMYPDRNIPDIVENNMTEIFPDVAPGNFTYLDSINQWVMTRFYNYQWDLNYKNPYVLLEMISNMLFLANKGVDVFRLDAVAYMWKEVGNPSVNLPQVHTLLQLFKLCGQVVAPGVAYVAEAIVQPDEIIKYFGENLAQGDECDIAYNANFMALSWEALATKSTELIKQSLKNIPQKPNGTTWINYARCHDDIGLGFSDELIYQIQLNPLQHRLFILQYYCDGMYESYANGERFMQEPNGNARISGSMNALCGLEKAQISGNERAIHLAYKRIILQHAVILSLGGIPMLYSGDEIALPNNYEYLHESDKKEDNRWLHRPIMNWNIINNTKRYPLENQLFHDLKHLINVRKNTPSFADTSNFELIENQNTHLLLFKRYHVSKSVLVIINFSNYDTNFSLFNKYTIETKFNNIITNETIYLKEFNFIESYGVLWLEETND